MPKRLILILIMIFAPLGAAADDTSPAAGLGPQATSASSGGSSADATALQPTTGSVLQSNSADSTGLSAPSSALQSPATSDETLTVLSGEADGAPQNTADTAAFPWGWLVFTVIFALIVTAGSIVVRDRRRFALTSLNQT